MVGFFDGTLAARTRNNSQSNIAWKSDATTKGSVRESRLSKGSGTDVLMTRHQEPHVLSLRNASQVSVQVQEMLQCEIGFSIKIAYADYNQ